MHPCFIEPNDHHNHKDYIMSIKNQPEFEPQDTSDVATEVNKVNLQDAGVAATTAIANAATTAVVDVDEGVQNPKFSVAFADKNCVFDTATVEGLALAAPRIKGEQGSMSFGDKELGTKIQFELISFNHRWAVGCGEENNESKDFFKVSYDNKTLSGDGSSISDYIESLKAQGFSKAKKSPYMDLWGFVTWSEKTGDIGLDDRQLACLQASQTSMGAFTAFATTRGLLESKGLAKPIDVIEVHAEKRTSGTNKYTNFSFHVPKAK